ncbi:hypothetical protein GOODEAATRI_025860, partial [Goodea atripinnis]
VCRRQVAVGAYVTPFPDRLHIITWNVGSAMPPDDITTLLGLNVGDGNTDMYIIGPCKVAPRISPAFLCSYPYPAVHFCPSGDIPANAGPVAAGLCQIFPSAFPPWGPDRDHPHRTGGLLGKMATDTILKPAGCKRNCTPPWLCCGILVSLDKGGKKCILSVFVIC